MCGHLLIILDCNINLLAFVYCFVTGYPVEMVAHTNGVHVVSPSRTPLRCEIQKFVGPLPRTPFLAANARISLGSATETSSKLGTMFFSDLYFWVCPTQER